MKNLTARQFATAALIVTAGCAMAASASAQDIYVLDGNAEQALRFDIKSGDYRGGFTSG